MSCGLHVVFCAQAAAGILLLLPVSPLHAADVLNMPPGQTSLVFVPVGNAGNAPEPFVNRGAVAYEYKISRYEVTIGQYVQFLNAVAKTDTYGLYNSNMSTNANVAGIARSGSAPNFSYSAIGAPNRPITH